MFADIEADIYVLVETTPMRLRTLRGSSGLSSSVDWIW